MYNHVTANYDVEQHYLQYFQRVFFIESNTNYENYDTLKCLINWGMGGPNKRGCWRYLLNLINEGVKINGRDGRNFKISVNISNK